VQAQGHTPSYSNDVVRCHVYFQHMTDANKSDYFQYKYPNLSYWKSQVFRKFLQCTLASGKCTVWDKEHFVYTSRHAMASPRFYFVTSSSVWPMELVDECGFRADGPRRRATRGYQFPTYNIIRGELLNNSVPIWI